MSGSLEHMLTAGWREEVDLNILYFERKKHNTDDNRRTVMLSVNKLTYIKTLRSYRTEVHWG